MDIAASGCEHANVLYTDLIKDPLAVRVREGAMDRRGDMGRPLHHHWLALREVT